jgi:hypothetical protein
VTEVPTGYLATMSVALVVTALMQIGVVIVAVVVARKLISVTEELRREVRPLVAKAHKISDDAARVTALAVQQVERVDQLLANTQDYVSETFGLVQQAVVQPVRQGAAVVAAVRAAIAAFRGWQDRTNHARDDEDALFVG